jgi:hypothetical protein
MLPITVLERVIRRAPLGLRCRDLARETVVSDGLTVLAWPLGRPAERRAALVSPLSGIHGFRSLPGLRGYEVGELPADAWCGSPPYAGALPAGELAELEGLVSGALAPPFANFVVTIDDRLGRFLPQTLFLCLPRESVLEVPLFAAPARPTPPGLGVVRAELWERAANRPASWALLTARADGETYVGLADARGMAVIFLPYARPLPPLVGSPPYGGAALDQLSWPVRIELFYQPAQQRRLAGRDVPDTRSLLEQAAARIYPQDAASAATSFIEPALAFRRELVLATAGQSRLLVDPI